MEEIIENKKENTIINEMIDSTLGIDPVKLTNQSIIKSVDYDQGNIIKNIIKLHIPSGKIDCDITMSKGNFYKMSGVELPTYKFDKFPQRDDTIKIENKILLDDESVNSIMCDLPFLISGKKDAMSYNEGSCVIGKRFNQYPTIKDLYDSYELWINESYRALKPKGILIFKCQDQISSKTQYLIHVNSILMMSRVGFYIKDLAIQVAKNRMIGRGHHKQQHMRKYHSYWIVAQKINSKVTYV